MTPAQVAHITPPLPFAVFDEFGQGCEDRVADHYRAAVEAALRDAPQQAEGWVMAPVEPTDIMEVFAENAYEDSGSPFPDWKAAYRAMLTARPSAPTAVEPDERAMFEAWWFDESVVEALEHAPSVEAECWLAWQAARASKGTPL